jgi:hypothetical protein
VETLHNYLSRTLTFQELSNGTKLGLLLIKCFLMVPC